MACSVASFGTFCQSDVTLYGLPLYRFSPQQFSDSFVCRSNERIKKCKSVKLFFFSPCLCCSNRNRVQLNMFSLSSLISQIRESVVRCCLQYSISFSPFNRALTRILKTGVQDSHLAKSSSPNGKSESPTPKKLESHQFAHTEYLFHFSRK